MKNGLADYLFIYKNIEPTDNAKAAALRYFGQGHGISFIQIHDWVKNNLATLSSDCRESFMNEIVDLLDSKDVPSFIKVKWNEIIRNITSV